MRLAALTPKPIPGGKDKAKQKPSRKPFSFAGPELSWASHAEAEAGSFGHGSALHSWTLPPSILPKLEVGGAHDPLERQADAVADRVMRMPAPQVQAVEHDSGGPTPEPEAERDDDVIVAPVEAAFTGGAEPPGGPERALRKCAGSETAGFASSVDRGSMRRRCAASEVDDVIQRECANCEAEDDERIMRVCASCERDDDDEPIMRETAGGERGGSVSDGFGARVRSRARSGGAPLPVHAKAFLEPRIGVDLSPVRVHDDAVAGSLARQINAHAFTLGQDIFFAPGQLRPHTHAGLRLLAHEVTHTLQSADPAVRARFFPPRPSHDRHRIPISAQSPNWFVARRRSEPAIGLLGAVTSGDQVVRRFEGPIEDLRAADLGADLGPDITDQDGAIQSKIDSVRHWLQTFIFDLVMPDKRAGIPSPLEDNRVPTGLRKQTERAAATFLGMTEQLEKSGSAPAAMLSRWLDKAIETLELLEKCLRSMIANAYEDFDAQVASDIAENWSSSKQKVNSVLGRARGARKHPFFRGGAELDQQIQEAWVDVRSTARDLYMEQQLEEAHQEMRDYWQWQSKDKIRAEKDRLTVNLLFGGQGTSTQLLQTQIDALQGLLDEVDIVHEPSQTERAEAIARLASEGQLGKAGVRVASLILSNELGATDTGLNAFSRTSSEWGNDTVRELAKATLQSLGPAAKPALDTLVTYERGRTLMSWLEASTDLEFAIISIRASHDSAQTTLESLSPSEARFAVQTATDVLHGCNLLGAYARTKAGKSLLVSMTLRLWESGYKGSLVRTGGLLGSAITPTRGYTGVATRLPADDEIRLVAKPIDNNTKIKINLQGRGYSALIDDYGFDKQTAQDLYLSRGVIVPIDSVVVFENAEGDEARLAPAIRLIEVNASSTRSAATALGQEIQRRVEVTSEVLDQGLESVGKMFVGAEKALHQVADNAYGWIDANLPPGLQVAAKAAVWVVEKVGTARLARAAAIAGLGVGFIKGASEMTLGTIALVGQGLEGVGGLSEGIQNGTLVQRVDISVRDGSRKIGFVIELAPELLDQAVGALVQEFGEGTAIQKSFMAGRAAGRITFEVAAGAMGGAAAKGKKLEDLMDLGADARRLAGLADEGPHVGSHELPDMVRRGDEPSHRRSDGQLDEAVQHSGGVESDILGPHGINDELEYILRNPELIEGAAPNRRVTLGEHTWTEGNGRWCRHSEPPKKCVPGALDKLSSESSAAGGESRRSRLRRRRSNERIPLVAEQAHVTCYAWLKR